MAKREAYLAIDFGTSNVHVTLIDAATTTFIFSTNKKYGWYTPEENQIELDAEEIWKASEWAVGDLMRRLPDDVHILVITFSYFGDNITPVDKDGNALYRMLPGFCGRSYKEVETYSKIMGAEKFAEITGNTLSTLITPSKILWLKRNHPDVFERTARFYSVQQYIMHKLGFGGIQDTTMASRKLAFDVKEDHWSEPILEIAGVTKEQMGLDIVESATVVGKITDYGSVKLPYGIPVTIGCHDVSASLLGAGVKTKDSDTVGVLMGTYEQMGYFSDEFIGGCNDFSDSLIFSCCYNSPFKGKYTVMSAFPTAGALVEWFCGNILRDPDADIRQLIADINLDSKSSLYVLPYVEKFHGAIVGISLSTTTKDILKGILESLAYQFVSCAGYIQSTRKKPFTEFHFGGGGSRSYKELQLRADLIRMPVGKMTNVELPSLGACMLADIGNGWASDIEEAAKHFVNEVQYFYPDEENGKNYGRRFQTYQHLSSDYLRRY